MLSISDSMPLPFQDNQGGEIKHDCLLALPITHYVCLAITYWPNLRARKLLIMAVHTKDKAGLIVFHTVFFYD